jgi:hypothetical protein
MKINDTSPIRVASEFEPIAAGLLSATTGGVLHYVGGGEHILPGGFGWQNENGERIYTNLGAPVKKQ